jgi:arginase
MAGPDVTLIGAPTDVGAGARGASMGPEALRVAGLAQRLEALGVAATDAGNLGGPPNPWQPPVRGYRHLGQVQAWCRAVRTAIGQVLADGRLPLLLGGDHSLAVGSLSAVARHCRAAGRRLRVLWLDAHADFNTPALTPSGNLHGMPLAVLCGMGPASLVRLAGPEPALAAAQVRLIGVRSVDAGEKRLVLDAGLPVRDMRAIDEQGMRAVMAWALHDLAPDEHLHLSFDLDFLDPAIAPGVGTPVRGGPGYREAQLCMEMIADTGRLGSIDLVELNPAQDERNRSAELAVELVESLFGRSTLLRR